MFNRMTRILNYKNNNLVNFIKQNHDEPKNFQIKFILK